MRLDRYEVRCAHCPAYSDRFLLLRSARRRLGEVRGRHPGFSWEVADLRPRTSCSWIVAATEALLTAAGWRRH